MPNIRILELSCAALCRDVPAVEKWIHHNQAWLQTAADDSGHLELIKLTNDCLRQLSDMLWEPGLMGKDDNKRLRLTAQIPAIYRVLLMLSRILKLQVLTHRSHVTTPLHAVLSFAPFWDVWMTFYLQRQAGWEVTETGDDLYDEKVSLILSQMFAAPSIIDCQDSGGNTALHIAVKSNKWDVLQLLVQTGARIDLPNRLGRTVFTALERLWVWARDTGADVEGPDGEVCVEQAAKLLVELTSEENWVYVKPLLQKNCDVDNYKTQPPIMQCITVLCDENNPINKAAENGTLASFNKVMFKKLYPTLTFDVYDVLFWTVLRKSLISRAQAYIITCLIGSLEPLRLLEVCITPQAADEHNYPDDRYVVSVHTADTRLGEAEENRLNFCSLHDVKVISRILCSTCIYTRNLSITPTILPHPQSTNQSDPQSTNESDPQSTNESAAQSTNESAAVEEINDMWEEFGEFGSLKERCVARVRRMMGDRDMSELGTECLPGQLVDELGRKPLIADILTWLGFTGQCIREVLMES